MTEDHEKFLVKDSFIPNYEPLIQENINLLEKIETLNIEIEILDKECVQYENLIEALNKRNNDTRDYKTFFLKSIIL